MMRKLRQAMTKRKPKTACRVQALKDAIDAERGSGEDRRLRQEEEAAQFADLVEWNGRYADAQQDYINQLVRLLDQHVPRWRERVWKVTHSGQSNDTHMILDAECIRWMRRLTPEELEHFWRQQDAHDRKMRRRIARRLAWLERASPNLRLRFEHYWSTGELSLPPALQRPRVA